MKRASTYFLQAVLVLMSINILIFLLLEPWFEGRNVGATFFEVYFKDPFLAYIYLALSRCSWGLSGFPARHHSEQSGVFS